jgi:hypothetical protein
MQENDSLDLTQPLTHWAEFYDARPAVQSIWTKASFAQLLKTKREFFSGTVQTLRSGVFVTEGFDSKLTEWLQTPRPNNVGTE